VCYSSESAGVAEGLLHAIIGAEALRLNRNPRAQVQDLAIFGNDPAFAEKVHIGRPNVGNRDRLFERINDMLDRNWLTNDGPYVQELEARIAQFVGVRHCVAMCNGTISLEIAIRALGLTGEVIVPSFTFVATAHALQWQEITPVFCDIDPRTHLLDPAKVERMITPRTTAIVGVHTWGRPCDVDALEEIARRRNVQLLFDAAHAFGCSYKGKIIGGFGRCEILSFHATKFFNTFEGGAVLTNDDSLAEKIKLMRNFGFSGYDNVIYIGTNGKMTEVCAAMGLTSLESVGQFIENNRKNYRQYQSELADVPGVNLVSYDESERANYQYIVCEIDELAAGLTRDELVRVLMAENVLARRYFYPGCHHMEPYESYFPHAGLVLPETENLCRRVMLLPTGTAIDAEAISHVCRIIGLAVANAPAIRDRLAAIPV
jgi:dTDP-4-amino-4,6-dideoxygalactose transaminase